MASGVTAWKCIDRMPESAYVVDIIAILVD